MTKELQPGEPIKEGVEYFTDMGLDVYQILDYDRQYQEWQVVVQQGRRWVNAIFYEDTE